MPSTIHLYLSLSILFFLFLLPYFFIKSSLAEQTAKRHDPIASITVNTEEAVAGCRPQYCLGLLYRWIMSLRVNRLIQSLAAQRSHHAKSKKTLKFLGGMHSTEVNHSLDGGIAEEPQTSVNLACFFAPVGIVLGFFATPPF